MSNVQGVRLKAHPIIIECVVKARTARGPARNEHRYTGFNLKSSRPTLT